MKWLFGMLMSREDTRQLSVNLHSLQTLHSPHMWGIWKKPKDADWWSFQDGSLKQGVNPSYSQRLKFGFSNGEQIEMSANLK